MNVQTTMSDLNTEYKDKCTSGLFQVGENSLFTTRWKPGSTDLNSFQIGVELLISNITSDHVKQLAVALGGVTINAKGRHDIISDGEQGISLLLHDMSAFVIRQKYVLATCLRDI